MRPCLVLPLFLALLVVVLDARPPVVVLRAMHRSAQAVTAPKPNWLPADKHGFGTSRTTASKVWFTLERGDRRKYQLVAGRAAGERLRAIAATVNDGGLLPEQVWDQNPPSGQPGFAPGTPTFSATPLAGATPSSSVSRGRSRPGSRWSSRVWWRVGTGAGAADHRTGR